MTHGTVTGPAAVLLLLLSTAACNDCPKVTAGTPRFTGTASGTVDGANVVQGTPTWLAPVGVGVPTRLALGWQLSDKAAVLRLDQLGYRHRGTYGTETLPATLCWCTETATLNESSCTLDAAGTECVNLVGTVIVQNYNPDCDGECARHIDVTLQLSANDSRATFTLDLRAQVDDEMGSESCNHSFIDD